MVFTGLFRHDVQPVTRAERFELQCEHRIRNWTGHNTNHIKGCLKYLALSTVLRMDFPVSISTLTPRLCSCFSVALNTRSSSEPLAFCSLSAGLLGGEFLGDRLCLGRGLCKFCSIFSSVTQLWRRLFT